MVAERQAEIRRETRETKIHLRLNLDRADAPDLETGVGFFDHMLTALGTHGRFGLYVRAKGDLEVGQHHTLEDVAICLGQAFSQALGERRGIVRMGHAVVPMDEALAMVAVDISGRGHASIEDVFLTGMDIGVLDTGLIRHFLETFASEAKLTLHARLLSGVNDHHKVEALFKALAKALDAATMIDDRRGGDVPSTKGTI